MKIMEPSWEDTVALLARTPAILAAWLSGLTPAQSRLSEGGNAWSLLEVVGHLIYGERTDWMPRIQLILKSGDARPFEPFDMKGHEAEAAGRSMPELLEAFARLRRQNLEALSGLRLRPEDLGRHGRHPELGRVTLGQLLSTWAAHDLTHLHQIARIQAAAYRAAVGPWAQYLGVLRCAGHSVN